MSYSLVKREGVDVQKCSEWKVEISFQLKIIINKKVLLNTKLVQGFLG